MRRKALAALCRGPAQLGEGLLEIAGSSGRKTLSTTSTSTDLKAVLAEKIPLEQVRWASGARHAGPSIRGKHPGASAIDLGSPRSATFRVDLSGGRSNGGSHALTLRCRPA